MDVDYTNLCSQQKLCASRVSVLLNNLASFCGGGATIKGLHDSKETNKLPKNMTASECVHV